MGDAPDGQIIDPTALQAIVEMIGADEPSVIVDLIDTYLVDSAKQIEDMSASLATGDYKTLHRAAHSMKSSSATFGAMHLSELCSVLEQSAKVNCENGLCADQVDALAVEHGRAVDALKIERERYAA